MDNREYMLIDGIPVEINGEKNLLELIRKAGIKLPTFVTIPNCRFTVPAVCAWLKMNGADWMLHVPPAQSGHEYKNKH